MDDLAIIDRFTETFSRYIDSGFGLLSGDVAFLTSILVAIDITLAGLFWALMGEDNVPAQLIRKVLYVGFFALLIGNFQSLADIVFQSFAGLGLKASGTSLTADDLMRPGFVASAGFSAAKPLLEKAGELIGITTFFSNFVTIAVLLLGWLIVLLAFFVLSVQLFITIIEFKLTVLAGFVLVPFALFGQTAFLAERVLGNVISSGIKLMVLAIVVGIGASIFGTLVRPVDEITLTQAASTILAAIAVFGLALFIPGLAAGLVSGAPQLGAGSAVATTAALGGTAVAGGMLAGGAARMTGRAAAGSVQAAASLTGRVGAAYEAGGPAGVARTLTAAPASRMIASGTAPVRDAWRRGAAQGYRDAGSAPGTSDPGTGPGGSTPPGPPGWAQSLARRQRPDLPGFGIAQVTEHVYDTVSGQFLLIPQGSRLVGRYDNVVARAMGIGETPAMAMRPVYSSWTHQAELVRRQRAAWAFAAVASVALCLGLATALSLSITRPAVALHVIERPGPTGHLE